MEPDIAALLAHIRAGLLTVKNGPLLELRARYWDAGKIDAALGVDAARNLISAALHDLRRDLLGVRRDVAHTERTDR